MRLTRDTLLMAALKACALLGLLLAAVGAVRTYSVVPFWDMWHGYLHFYQLATEGRWGEWWALHNEHRILLARLLFWVDLAVFDGTLWFLLLVNWLLALGAFLTFRAMLRELAGPDAPPRPLLALQLLMVMSLFSWMQSENFTWGFQSQFFLAQWLPLLALYLLYRSGLPGPGAERDFLLACGVGALCIGTMASGVIALPLMVAYAALQRMPARRLALLVVLTLACLALYFHGYQSTPGHGSLRDVLRHRPVLLAQYVLLYIGAPGYYLSGGHSLAVGQWFGGAFVLLASAAAWRCLRAPRAHALELALLAFILYVGGTALGTGAGRLVFGLGQATASRYTTPALMAWMALLVLYAPPILRSLANWQHRTVWPLLVLALALTSYQWSARKSQRHVIFEREVAALGLALRVRDDNQIRHIHFNIDWALLATEEAVRRHWSVFGRDRFRGVGLLIGQPAGALAPAVCRAVVTEVADVPLDKRWKRITGWVAPLAGANDIDRVRLVDDAGQVVGYGLAGELKKRSNPDIAIGSNARPFKGYVRATDAYATLRVAASGTDCTAPLQPLPRPPFSVQPASQWSPLAPPSAVLANEGFSGTDWQRTRVAGFRVLGSVVKGDVDMGTIRLRMRRGDALHYRSGPINANQRYAIEGAPGLGGLLPVSDSWVALVFDNPALPDTFTLTLTDGGTGWGEWSAIAVQE